MSSYQKSLTMVGLTLAAAALATPLFGRADDPPAPSAPARSDPYPAEEHLMLTNGYLLKGVIQEEENAYSVTQRAGVMKFAKNKVEGVFKTLQDAYKYKISQLPERDPDERMKLAHWCLNLDLKAEARDQLAQILKQNPSNPQAKAMLVSMDQAASRLAMRRRDPDVRRTKAEAPIDPDRPRALDSAVIRDAQTALGISNTPVIFDLPRPLAIRRTDEFIRFVHPLLQAYCAKCHNERFQGDFQLLTIKTKADRTPDAMRANLDATLRLVDPENPARSELLSSTLRPHGVGAGKRPIFPGSNDRAYQVLATWVGHLASKKNPNEAGSAEPSPDAAAANADFAADRPRIGRQGTNRPVTTVDPSALMKTRPAPAPPRFVPDPDGPADDEQFPLPFTVGGKKANLPAPSNPLTKNSPAADREDDSIDPKVKPTAATNPTSDKDAKPKAAKPKPPIKIDPAILERALQLRNQTRPPSP